MTPVAEPSRRRRSAAPDGSSGSRCWRSSILWLDPDAWGSDHFVPTGGADGLRPGGGRCSRIRSETAEWTFENYRLALDAGGLGNAFLNSLAVALPATVIPITIAAFAAYAFSWMDFRGRYVMFIAVVALLVVPLQMALIPILRLYNNGAIIGGRYIFPDLDLVGTFLGVWLAHTAFGLPLAVYLLRNYIGSLPRRSSSRPRSTEPTTSRSSGG